MIDFQHIELQNDFVRVRTHLDEAASFFGYKSFDDCVKTANSPEESDRVLKLADLLQRKKHEAAGLFAERISQEMSFFHRSMKWLAALAIVSISISGGLVAIFILHY